MLFGQLIVLVICGAGYGQSAATHRSRPVVSSGNLCPCSQRLRDVLCMNSAHRKNTMVRKMIEDALICINRQRAHAMRR